MFAHTVRSSRRPPGQRQPRPSRSSGTLKGGYGCPFSALQVSDLSRFLAAFCPLPARGVAGDEIPAACGPLSRNAALRQRVEQKRRGLPCLRLGRVLPQRSHPCPSLALSVSPDEIVRPRRSLRGSLAANAAAGLSAFWGATTSHRAQTAVANRLHFACFEPIKPTLPRIEDYVAPDLHPWRAIAPLPPQPKRATRDVRDVYSLIFAEIVCKNIVCNCHWVASIDPPHGTARRLEVNTYCTSEVILLQVIHARGEPARLKPPKAESHENI